MPVAIALDYLEISADRMFTKTGMLCLYIYTHAYTPIHTVFTCIYLSLLCMHACLTWLHAASLSPLCAVGLRSDSDLAGGDASAATVEAVGLTDGTLDADEHGT